MLLWTVMLLLLEALLFWLVWETEDEVKLLLTKVGDCAPWQRYFTAKV